MKFLKSDLFFSSTLFATIILVDQITKVIFASRDFFIGNVHLHLVKNFGLSFGLNFGTWANSIILGIALALFGFYIFQSKNSKNINQWAVVLVFAGAIGNFLDRIVYGYVRDFIDLSLGFTFNIADVYILLGLIILLSQSNLDKKEDDRKPFPEG